MDICAKSLPQIEQRTENDSSQYLSNHFGLPNLSQDKGQDIGGSDDDSFRLRIVNALQVLQFNAPTHRVELSINAEGL